MADVQDIVRQVVADVHQTVEDPVVTVQGTALLVAEEAVVTHVLDIAKVDVLVVVQAALVVEEVVLQDVQDNVLILVEDVRHLVGLQDMVLQVVELLDVQVVQEDVLVVVQVVEVVVVGVNQHALKVVEMTVLTVLDAEDALVVQEDALVA